MEEGEDPEKRRIENLRAVYGHLVAGAPARPILDEAAPAAAPAPKRRGLVGGLLAALSLVLGKLKFFGLLAGALKLKTLLTMALSIGVYATQWGFAFASGFVLLIFVHELGHVIELRRQGIPASAPVFIPFVGALVAMRGMPRNAYVEARVGIAGPILGCLGAWIVLALAGAAAAPALAAIAHVALLINLFNLIPVSPLDGGRVAGAFPRPFWIAGYALGIVALVLTRSALLFLVLLVGLWTLWRRLRHPVPGYDRIEPRQRWGMALAYAFLVGGILATLPAAAALAGRAVDPLLE